MTVVGDASAKLRVASEATTIQVVNSQTYAATDNRLGRLLVSMGNSKLFSFIGVDGAGEHGADQWRDISPAAFRGPYTTSGIAHNWNAVIDLVDPNVVAYPYSEGYYGTGVLIGTSDDYGSFVQRNGLLFLAAYSDGIWAFNGTTWFREHMWSGQQFSHVFVWNDELWAVSDGQPGTPALSPQTTGWSTAQPFKRTNYFWRRNANNRTWTAMHRFKGGYEEGENLPHPFMSTPPLTFADSSGNGRTASLSGGTPTTNVAGLIPGDTCVEWPGYAEVPTTINWTGNWTVETWVRAVSPNSLDGHFISSSFSGGQLAHLDCSFESADQSVRLFFGSYGGIGGGLAITTAGIPVDGNAHHIVGVVAGGGVTPHIYMDGVEATITSFIPPNPLSGSPSYTRIGRGGAIRQDETAIYEYALSAGQVASHYAARSSFSSYSATVLGDGPAAYYHLNDVVGPPFEDFDQAQDDDMTMMDRPQQLLTTTIGGQDVLLIGSSIDKWGAYGPSYGDHPIDDWGGSCAYALATFRGYTWSFEFDSIVFRSSNLSGGFDKLQVLVADDTRPFDVTPEYPYPLQPGYTQGDMWCCVEVNGRLYVGDGGGHDAADHQNHCHLWAVKDDLSGVEFVTETGVVDGCFNAMAADSASRVYIGTSFGSLYRYSGSTLAMFTDFRAVGLSGSEQINWIGGVDLHSGITTVGAQGATLNTKEPV